MTAVKDPFQGVTRLGIDTTPIIYFVEKNPVYDTFVTAIFQRIAAGAMIGVTSVITLTEVLNYPIRQGATELAQRYRSLLTNSQHFELISIDANIASQAAQLRAHYNLRTPDALQVSVAFVSDCQAFLTNDKGLKRVLELPIILLDHLLSTQPTTKGESNVIQTRL